MDADDGDESPDATPETRIVTSMESTIDRITVRPLEQDERDPFECKGALGRRIIHQTEHDHDWRHSQHEVDLKGIVPVTLYELARALPDLGLRAGDYVLIRYGQRVPIWTPLALSAESVVCAWAGEERGITLLPLAEYDALVPEPFRLCDPHSKFGGHHRAHHIAGLGVLVAAFRSATVGESATTLCDPLPALKSWRDGRESRDVRQDGCVGEGGYFAEDAGSGLFYLWSYEAEAEDDEWVRRSADGAVMRWAHIKRKWKSEAARQYDTVLLAAFERIV